MTDDAVAHLRACLGALGLDAGLDPELGRTPERFVGLLGELFRGLSEEPPAMSCFAPPAGQGQGEPVLLLALPFYSVCVHHLVPFFGTMDVAFVPHERMVGFGSVGRVIEHFARRPQVQEQLVSQIAAYLEQTLAPSGVFVRCRARQMCMEMRGNQRRGVLVSSDARGVLSCGALREEVLRQCLAAEGPL